MYLRRSLRGLNEMRNTNKRGRVRLSVTVSLRAEGSRGTRGAR